MGGANVIVVNCRSPAAAAARDGTVDADGPSETALEVLGATTDRTGPAAASAPAATSSLDAEWRLSSGGSNNNRSRHELRRWWKRVPAGPRCRQATAEPQWATGDGLTYATATTATATVTTASPPAAERAGAAACSGPGRAEDGHRQKYVREQSTCAKIRAAAAKPQPRPDVVFDRGRLRHTQQPALVGTIQCADARDERAGLATQARRRPIDGAPAYSPLSAARRHGVARGGGGAPGAGVSREWIESPFTVRSYPAYMLLLQKQQATDAPWFEERSEEREPWDPLVSTSASASTAWEDGRQARPKLMDLFGTRPMSSIQEHESQGQSQSQSQGRKSDDPMASPSLELSPTSTLLAQQQQQQHQLQQKPLPPRPGQQQSSPSPSPEMRRRPSSLRRQGNFVICKQQHEAASSTGIDAEKLSEALALLTRRVSKQARQAGASSERRASSYEHEQPASARTATRGKRRGRRRRKEERKREETGERRRRGRRRTVSGRS